MREIEKRFTGRGEVKGVEFFLLKREGLESLWKRSDGFYEVVRLVERKAATAIFDGVEVNFEAKETYPQGESWGTLGHGKCLSTRKKAEAYYKTRIYEQTI